MGKSWPGAAERHFRTLYDVGVPAGLSDRELLERSTPATRDGAEAAFAAIVDRHGPLVLRTCLSVLREEHEAFDAFQATFLVLARKRESLWIRESVAPWLHRVALRVALRARRARERRRVAERTVAEHQRRSLTDLPPDDSAEIIHEELNALPDRFRIPVVLCDLEGRRLEETAQQLGCPLGTLKSRLFRARNRLKQRLTRRGVSLAGPAVVGAALATNVCAASAARRMSISSLLAFGNAVPAGTVPRAGFRLAEDFLRSMLMTKLRFSAYAVMSCVALSSAVVLARPGNAPGHGHPPTVPAAAGDTSKPDVESKNDVIRRKLEQTVDYKLSGEATLDLALKAVRKLSQGPDGNDIPIYVEPAGLAEVGHTLDSRVNITLTKVPLGFALRGVLRPLGLSYEVRDGLLVIDSRSALLESRMEALVRDVDILSRRLAGPQR